MWSPKRGQWSESKGDKVEVSDWELALGMDNDRVVERTSHGLVVMVWGWVGGWVHRCHMYSGAGCMDVWVRNMVTEDNTYSWTLNGSPRNPNCEDGDGYTCVTICLQLEADPADMFYTCHFLPITCCTQLSVRGLE